MVFSSKMGFAGGCEYAAPQTIPIGCILKLNLDAVCVRDEQLRRVAALRYLGIADTEIGKTPHNALGIEIRDRHAVREEIGFGSARNGRQSKEVGPLADGKYDGTGFSDRRSKQPFIEGRGARQIRDGDPHIVQASGSNHRPCLLRHQAR
jgi:hypothetical protein